MPERMGIRELRDNLTATIRRVRDGATIEITHHHEPVALITPFRRDRLAALVQAGEATPAVPLDRPIRKFRATTGITASEALAEDRAAER